MITTPSSPSTAPASPLEAPAAPTSESGSLLRFVLAALYATVLASLPVDAFQDRANYLAYADYSDLILLRYVLDGWLTIISNEPIWLALNAALATFLDPYALVRFLIFTSSFATAMLVLKKERHHLFWIVLFLLFPLVIKNYIIHLRQGVAVALFLTGYFSKNKRFGIFLIALTPFVHSSFFFILMIYIMTLASKRINFPVWARVLVFASFFIFLGLTLGAVSSSLGARQANEYQNVDIGVSGLAFAFWFIILTVFMAEGKNYINDNTFSVLLLAFYLAVYFFTVVSGRIFESGILVVLVSGLYLTSWRRFAFISIILAFSVLNYATHLNEPWLGWGI